MPNKNPALDQKNYFLKHSFAGKGLISPDDGHAGLIIIHFYAGIDALHP